MTKVLIEIRGGVLQSVFSTEPIKYMLVDHDNLSEDPSSPWFTPQDLIVSEEEMEKYGITASNQYLTDENEEY